MRHDDAQDTDPSAEGMMLQHDSGRATVKVVCADRREMLDSAETVRFWTSPFYLTRFMDPGTRIVLSDHNRCSGAVVMVGRDENGEPVVTMKETYSTGYRSAVRVTLTAPLDSFEEAYRQARESLQIDHRPMFRFFGCDVLDVVLA